MIVQFFARGKGGGSGPTDYLLGKDRAREDATLLRGDPDETAAIIDGSQYAKKYTSGCLSFEETNISEEKKRELMDSFEECIFAGLDANQYNCLWVEHRDKGRLELNFVIPNVELTTGKRLQPFYHESDKGRVDAWRTIQNLTHGFTDPDDPAKRQALTTAKDLPRGSQEAAEAINRGLQGLALSGQINSRNDVVNVNALQSAGLEIARTTKSSISIKNPEQDGRNIRLKGAMYEQDFRFSQDIRADLEARSREHRAEREERLSAAREKYRGGISAKREEHQKRHPRSKQTRQYGDIEAILVDIGSVGSGGGNHVDFAARDGDENQRPLHRDSGAKTDIGHDAEHDQRLTTEQMQDTGRPRPSMCGDRQHSAAELGQKGRIQGDIAEVRGNHDRNRETAVRRITELGNQSETDREANAKRLREITAESDIAGTRKRAFNEAAAAIIRGVASLREYARKLEEIARDHLQRPRRKATKDNDSGGYSR